MNASAIETAAFFRWRAVEGEFDNPLRLHEARVSRIGEDSLIVVASSVCARRPASLCTAREPDGVAFVRIRRQLAERVRPGARTIARPAGPTSNSSRQCRAAPWGA
jgi:hypothetical protein